MKVELDLNEMLTEENSNKVKAYAAKRKLPLVVAAIQLLDNILTAMGSEAPTTTLVATPAATPSDEPAPKSSPAPAPVAEPSKSQWETFFTGLPKRARTSLEDHKITSFETLRTLKLDEIKTWRGMGDRTLSEFESRCHEFGVEFAPDESPKKEESRAEEEPSPIPAHIPQAQAAIHEEEEGEDGADLEAANLEHKFEDTRDRTSGPWNKISNMGLTDGWLEEAFKIWREAWDFGTTQETRDEFRAILTRCGYSKQSQESWEMARRAIRNNLPAGKEIVEMTLSLMSRLGYQDIDDLAIGSFEKNYGDLSHAEALSILQDLREERRANDEANKGASTARTSKKITEDDIDF